MAPVLIIAIAIAGFFLGPEAVPGEIVGQIDGLLGTEGAHAVQALLEDASKREAGVVALVVGTFTFLLASTGVFLELQHALSTIFRVKQEPEINVSAFVKARIRSFGVITLLFALIYRFLPDVKLRWRDVWIGSVMTAALFTVGKQIIGLYLGRSSLSSSYDAAGSVIVLLLSVYYSSQIVLFGAELTRVYTERAHGKPPTEPFAVSDPTARPAAAT